MFSRKDVCSLWGLWRGTSVSILLIPPLQRRALSALGGWERVLAKRRHRFQQSASADGRGMDDSRE